MRLALPALGAAAALGVAINWTPLPRAWFDAAPAADTGPAAPRVAAMTPPVGIEPSAAVALVQFGAPAAVDASGSGAVAPPQKPGPPVLVGLIGAGPRRIAYILFVGQTTRAGIGDKVGGWRLAAIGPHDATLRDGRKTLALALYGPRPAPPPPQPTTPVAPDTAPVVAASSPVVPKMHALEPASAPAMRAQSGERPKYWVGGGKAPPGYILLKPGELPPQ